MNKKRLIFLISIIFIAGSLFSSQEAVAVAETITLWPNGPGAQTSLNYIWPEDIPQHWQAVNTADDTTYVGNAWSAGYLGDLYALQDPTGAPRNGTINKVTIYARTRVGYLIAGQQTSKVFMRTNNTNYSGSENSLDYSWQNFSKSWNTNPVTGNPWTWDEIDNLQSGVQLRNENSDGAVLCSQVFVEIDYTLPIQPPTVTTEIADVGLQNNNATLKGNLIDMGGAGSCDVWFQWGTTTSYGNETTHTPKTSTGIFSAIINISPDIIYHFRAVADNSTAGGGINYGGDRSVVIYTASGGQKQFTTNIIDNPPEISISCPECTEIKNIGDVVSVTVSATDDSGLNQLYFAVGGDREGSGLPNPWEDYFSCNGAISCSRTWNITLDAFGPNLASWDWTFLGNAEDTVGQWGDYAGTGVKDIFDFNLSVSPNSGSVIQGEFTPATITANLVSPATRSVSFSASGLPSGASVSFSPTSCNPTCDSTMTITTSVTTLIGTYSITIKGENGNLVRTTTYNLTVTATDIIPPTTEIKIIRTSTGEDVTAAEAWLRADTYTIEFSDTDPEPLSGWKSCEYYVYDTQASTYVVSPTPRTCGNWSFNITAGTSPYDKEGAGAYLIYSLVIDNADLSGDTQIGLNFDFTPPETWIE